MWVWFEFDLTFFFILLSIKNQEWSFFDVKLTIPNGKLKFPSILLNLSIRFTLYTPLDLVPNHPTTFITIAHNLNFINNEQIRNNQNKILNESIVFVIVSHTNIVRVSWNLFRPRLHLGRNDPREPLLAPNELLTLLNY